MNRRHYAVQFGSDAEGWSQSKAYPLAYDSVDTALEALTYTEDWPENPEGPVPPCYRIVRITGGANGFPENIEPVMVYDLRVVFLSPPDGDHTAINDAFDKLRGTGPMVATTMKLVI